MQQDCARLPDDWVDESFGSDHRASWKRYVGQVNKSGLPHGSGFLMLRSGAFQAGGFVDGEGHGLGCYCFEPPQDIFIIGSWANDSPHGVCFEQTPNVCRLSEFHCGQAVGLAMCSGVPMSFDELPPQRWTGAVDNDVVCDMTGAVIKAIEFVRIILQQARFAQDVQEDVEGSLQRIDDALFLLAFVSEGGISGQGPLDVFGAAAGIGPWIAPPTDAALLTASASETHGLGCRAAQNILPQQCLVTEAPLFLARPGNLDGIDDLVNSLSPELAARFWDLYDNLSSTHGSGDKTAHGVFLTNCMQCGPCSDTCGVFATLSRLNHSCAPNAHCYWDENVGKKCLVSAKHISKGEEICISYAPMPGWPQRRRLEYLKDNFGFDCSCNACATGIARAADERRAHIDRLDAWTHKLISQPRLALNMVEHRIRLLAREDFDVVHETISWSAFDAYRLALLAGSPERAEQWLQVHVSYLRLARGSDAEATKRAEALLQDPFCNQHALDIRNVTTRAHLRSLCKDWRVPIDSIRCSAGFIRHDNDEFRALSFA